MKYRRKPEHVEAFQLTEERMNHEYLWPEWLRKAWDLPPGKKGSVFFHNKFPNMLCVQTKEDGTEYCAFNYWIVKDEDDWFSVYSTSEFELWYEPV